MKLYLTYLLFFSLIVGFTNNRKNEQPNVTKKWVLHKGGILQIHGKSNIHSFVFSVNEYTNSDTIFIKNTNDENAVTGSLAVKINNFRCNHSYLKDEFKKILLADKFPILGIKILSFKKIITTNNVQKLTTSGLVEIDLAGVKKNFLVDYVFSKTQENKLLLSGVKTLSFADFNLKAPQKFGGLFKVKEDLTITFNLNFTEVN